MPKVQTWFPTLIYATPVADSRSVLNRELRLECGQLRQQDAAGRRWSAERYPGGYTSYGSLDQLHRMSSTFISLREKLDRHVLAFARALHWNLRGHALAMTDCWVNLMPKGTAHSLHLHPNSAVSGTYYVQVPKGSPGLKFEDPRLSRMMASPPRKAGGPAPHIVYPARPGHAILFESWLRHEVPANPVRGERISISFNYHWT